MNITLHIERLVLEGLPLAPGQAGQLRAALEQELGRLLGERGLAPGLGAGAPALRAASIDLAGNPSAAALGQQLAAAVMAEIGSASGGRP